MFLRECLIFLDAANAHPWTNQDTVENGTELQISKTKIYGVMLQPKKSFHTVDGWNPANQLRLVVFPIIFWDSYIPGGADFSHQQ